MTDESLSFMARLKRHHIFRVASMYAIAAWVLIQLGNSIFPNLGWPRRSILILIVAVALLLPVVMILAWMFIPPSKEDPAKYSRWHKLRWRLGSVLSLLIILLVTASGVLLWRANVRHMQAQQTIAAAKAASGTPAVATAIPAKSVAVLPFENLSADKNNAYFASGMQDMILTKLADIGDLKVIARSSTEKYASHPDDLKTIAQQLGVATILEGSVQKAGNQVLINVQLIDAKTDTHIWAQAYSRNLDNVFGVEGEVAQKVAEALKAKLTHAESQQLATSPTQNPQAYDLYLQGEYYWNRAESSFLKSDFDTAIQNYHAAVELDPQFALAWARMAIAQLLRFYVHGDDGLHLAAAAKTAIKRALKLAPNLSDGYIAQGLYEDYVKNDFDAALAAFETAHTLSPQNVDAIFSIGIISNDLGHRDAAINAFQQALVINPRSVETLSELAFTYMAERDYEQAERVIKQILAIDPEAVLDRVNLSEAILLQAGNIDQAIEVLDAAPANLQNNPNILSERVNLVLMHRDYTAARILADKLQPGPFISTGEIQMMKGDVEWYAGNHPQAREHYQRSTALIDTALKSIPSDSEAHGELGLIYARLGRKRYALHHAQLAVKLAPNNRNWGALAQLNAAKTYCQLGDVGTALDILDRLLATPTGQFISVQTLKLDPAWDSIRNDPRFETLLKKYGNEGSA